MASCGVIKVAFGGQYFYGGQLHFRGFPYRRFCKVSYGPSAGEDRDLMYVVFREAEDRARYSAPKRATCDLYTFLGGKSQIFLPRYARFCHYFVIF